MLAGAGAPMPRQDVLDIVAGGGMANCFETGAALDDLLRHGSVVEENDCLSVTEAGRKASDTLYNRLPFTLRERSVQAAVRLLARRRSERETKVDITALSVGQLITCTILDGEEPLMAVSARVADLKQAEMIRDRFLDNPTLVYRSLIAVMTGGAIPQNNQIVIDLK